MVLATLGSVMAGALAPGTEGEGGHTGEYTVKGTEFGLASMGGGGWAVTVGRLVESQCSSISHSPPREL